MADQKTIDAYNGQVDTYLKMVDELGVDPVDAAKAMVQLVNNKLDIAARQTQFSDIDTINTYHGVWTNFRLLHAQLQHLAAILMALHKALKPKGFLYLGMKLGQGHQRDKYGRYYAYYSQAELETHLTAAGFSIEQVEVGESVGLVGHMEAWIVLTGVSN